MRIRDSLGAHVSHIQTKTPAEFEENFRQYGAQHYDIVFGHGFEFQDAARRVAPDFPKTLFVTTSGTTAGPNLAGMTFGFADASYLAGVLAASMTKSKQLGVLGGAELPPVVESFRAFEQGARAVDPSIRVVTSYIGNWDDVSAGKEQALAQLARNAEGHELAYVHQPDALPPEVRRTLEEELAVHEFVPTVTRILEVVEDSDSCRWQLETDRGPIRILTSDENAVRRLGPRRVIILDTTGIRYLIPDMDALDKASLLMLDQYV